MTAARRTLWDALQANDLAGVTRALAEGADPNGGYGGWHPVGRALRHGTPDIALALISAGADVHGREQGTSFLQMAIARPHMISVVQALLEQGAKPSPGALRGACRAGNAEAAVMLLERGAAAIYLKEGSTWPGENLPALGHWPAKKTGEVPEALVAATFGAPLEDVHAQALAIESARRHDDWLAGLIIERGQLSPRARDRMLYHHLHSHRQSVVTRLLDMGYCSVQDSDPSEPPILAACASWLHKAGERGVAWKFLERIVQAGWRLEGESLSYTKDQQGQRGRRAHALAMLEMATDHSRPRMLRWFAEQQLNPVFVFPEHPESNTTLAHFLIRQGHWKDIARLPKLWPDAHWEQDTCEELVHAWARLHHSDLATLRHGQTKHTTEVLLESLQIIADLPGCDVARRNAQGHTALRTLLGRQDSAWSSSGQHSANTLDALVRALIEAGCDPGAPDALGVTDLDYARAILRGPRNAQMIAGWEMLAMERATEQARPAKPRGIRL